MHRTAVVYRRYAVVSDQDLQEAAAKLAVARSHSTVDPPSRQEGRK